MNQAVLYGQDVLPQGIRSRVVDNNNGCRMHILEAGFENPRRGCVLLLHGFPEIAFSWRKQVLPLAAAGFHVVAPDQRGYGRSSGTDVSYGDDLLPFTLINHVSDALGLVRALGYEQVACVVGHDFGSPVAGWCALLRPDVFRSLVLMSAPFTGAPLLALGTAQQAPAQPTAGAPQLPAALASLHPPRKHYWWYYATPTANEDMWHCPQGVHAFLRAYYHMKSADWEANKPFRLASWDAAELAKLPTYYVMDLDRDMAATVAEHAPGASTVRDCAWLTEQELRVYSAEYGRTGFQGGLQSYRMWVDPLFQQELRAFSGRTVDVRACFVSGASDWGTYQGPGAVDQMRRVCPRMGDIRLVPGAGHWVQQEQPQAVNELLLEFILAS